MEQVKATTGYQWAKRTTTNRLYAELASKPKRNKFGAIKVTIDGYTFDSRKEAAHYETLKQLSKAKAIANLRVHPKYDLAVNGVKIATYKPDFDFVDDTGPRVIDVKSPPTAKKRDFVLIKKLMAAIHGIDVEVIT